MRAEDAKPVLEFERLDLTDGRSLRKVVVKNYDPVKNRVLLVARGTAMFVSLTLVPEPLQEKLKAAAPQSGSSVSITPTPVRRPLSANPQYPQPGTTAQPQPGSDFKINAQEHQNSALERARNYYRYEFQAGSSSIHVTAINFETDEPEKITGWEGRYRIHGRVLLEYFDSKGYSYNRATDRFEVITEQKPGHAIKVIDFSRK
jgi:hypothetical protein